MIEEGDEEPGGAGIKGKDEEGAGKEEPIGWPEREELEGGTVEPKPTLTLTTLPP